MIIDWTKPIETVDGRLARVLATDIRDLGGRVVVIAISENDTSEYVDRVTLHGHLYPNHSEPFIRNRRVKREGWVNLYRIGGRVVASDVHATQQAADAEATDPHLACVRIEWEE